MGHFHVYGQMQSGGAAWSTSSRVSRPTSAYVVYVSLGPDGKSTGAPPLLLETDEHPGKLKDMVTSPGGTAIAGLHTLEQGGLRTTLINAVETATKRARELGQGRK